MTHQLKLPIGDWMNTGHGECHYYVIESDRPENVIREAHTRIEDVLGVKLEYVCAERGDNTVDLDTAERLLELGIGERYLKKNTADNYTIEKSVQMLRIWTALLNYIEPTLNLRQTSDTHSAVLFGGDAHKEYIGNIGYGLF